MSNRFFQRGQKNSRGASSPCAPGYVPGNRWRVKQIDELDDGELDEQKCTQKIGILRGLSKSNELNDHQLDKFYCTTFWQTCEIGSQLNFWYVRNNHIKTTNFFSVRSTPEPPIFKKIAVQSSLDPAKIGITPDPCLSLVCSLNQALHSSLLFYVSLNWLIVRWY